MTTLVDRVVERLVEHSVPDPSALPSVVADLVAAEAPLLSPTAAEEAIRRVLARSVGLGPLDPLLSDPAVSEVMVNGRGDVWVERHGVVERTDVVVDAATRAHLVERVLAPLGQRVDRASPVVDARLRDGSRVNVIVPPASVDGTCVTIRRFVAARVELDDICPPGVADLLRWAVAGRSNIVVSGATGSGKTTLLNSLAALLDRRARVITIEDAAELDLPGDHVVRLEAQRPNAEGVGEVTIHQLVRNALRMRPDHLVVGEVRGGEALDMVWAMSTGHDGSLSTCHANGPVEALARLHTMVLQAGVDLPSDVVRSQLVEAVDLVVHTERRLDGSRGVKSVFEPGHDGGRMVATDQGLVDRPRRSGRRPGHPAAPEPEHRS